MVVGLVQERVLYPAIVKHFANGQEQVAESINVCINTSCHQAT